MFLSRILCVCVSMSISISFDVNSILVRNPCVLSRVRGKGMLGVLWPWVDRADSSITFSIVLLVLLSQSDESRM